MTSPRILYHLELEDRASRGLLAMRREHWSAAPYTDLFHLAYHVGNLIEPESLPCDEGFSGARPLANDCAPVDVLAARG